MKPALANKIIELGVPRSEMNQEKEGQLEKAIAEDLERLNAKNLKSVERKDLRESPQATQQKEQNASAVKTENTQELEEGGSRDAYALEIVEEKDAKSDEGVAAGDERQDIPQRKE